MNRSILLITALLAASSLTAQEVEKKQIKQQQHDHRYDEDLLTREFHAERREALRDLLPENSVAVVFAAPVRNRSNDVDYEYHQNPDFYYLTGVVEPHAMVMIFKDIQKVDGKKVDEIIYVQERDPSAETWNGKRLGTEGTQKALGFEVVGANYQFAESTFDFSKLDHVYFTHPGNDVRDDKQKRGDLASLTKHFLKKTGKLETVDSRQLSSWMAELREIKLEEEMRLLREAINMTCDAQTELMRALEPGMKEFQSEAIVEYVFKKNGAEYPGFPSILGGGENSCILHYTTNRKPLINGDLLVSDIGAEYHGYTADVTRTIPVDGHYSEEEAIIYNIVLEAQNAGIDACKVGNKFYDPHTAATQIIAKKLLELGIIKKSFEVQNYFMHGTSHYLGLDVHDAGLYGALKPGNVITVEPGIYIPEGSDCDPKWWNIGVRIEDDILITENGPENLSAKAPRTIEEIEALMKEESFFNKMK